MEPLKNKKFGNHLEHHSGIRPSRKERNLTPDRLCFICPKCLFLRGPWRKRTATVQGFGSLQSPNSSKEGLLCSVLSFWSQAFIIFVFFQRGKLEAAMFVLHWNPSEGVNFYEFSVSVGNISQVVWGNRKNCCWLHSRKRREDQGSGENK